MIIKKLEGGKDKEYPSREGKEDLKIIGAGSYGGYALDIRTNKLIYEIEIMKVNDEIKPISIVMEYNEEDIGIRVNKITQSFRLNIGASVEKVEDKYTLYDIDGTISEYKEGNEGYYNVTKKNGEILTKENNKIEIEEISGNKKYFNASGNIEKYVIKRNEERINYEIRYGEDGAISAVAVNDEEKVKIIQEENGIRITYKEKEAKIRIEEQKVTEIEIANGMKIRYTYEGNKIKRVETAGEDEANVSDKIEITYENAIIKQIDEYRKEGYIQRTITVEKHGENYLVSEKERDISIEREQIYSFDEKTGKVKYVYDKQYSEDVLNSNIRCFLTIR